tara:strand:- start:644 stop:1762 length:1119 start_codon:yes stop_codon:yes gene_type:complete
VIIGVPKEIKPDENRVSLPPDKVEVLVSDGHKVIVESGAGQGSRFSDDTYLYGAGATIVSGPAEIYGTAELIVKVKEPQPNEFDLIQEGQTIFTYLHLAAELDLLDCMLKKNVTGIAYETVEDDKGRLSLLHPMSEIAGRLVSQVSARLLTNIESGVGKLLSGVPGSGNCSAFIIGGGTVGLNAATALMGAGADVTVADINLDRIREIDTLTNGHVKTIYPTPAALAEKVQRSEVVVGAVLVPGAKAPKIVSRDMVKDMMPGGVIIDVAIDQGGCVEGIRPTSHQNPTYIQDDVIHYAVTNMPGIVGHTASISLSNATLPYVRSIAKNGVHKAITLDSSLAKGVNTIGGQITYPALAESLSMTFSTLEEMLS